MGHRPRLDRDILEATATFRRGPTWKESRPTIRFFSRAPMVMRAIANSAALKIAGIDQKTPNPFGGEILKDKQDR